MKYREKDPKPKIVDAITFDELVEYGKANGANIVNDMPWSFEYKGLSITHETDTHYLVLTEFGETIDFTSEDVLLIERKGTHIHTIFKYIFDSHYELVN